GGEAGGRGGGGRRPGGGGRGGRGRARHRGARGGPAREGARPRIRLPIEGLEGDAEPEGVRSPARVEHVRHLVGEVRDVGLFLGDQAGQPIREVRRTFPTHRAKDTTASPLATSGAGPCPSAGPSASPSPPASC